MTLRYAHLASDTVRSAYDAAMTKSRTRRLPLLVAGAFVPNRVAWLQAEMLKTRVAHGYCARHPAAGACPLRQHQRAVRQLHARPESAGALTDQLAASSPSATTPSSAAGDGEAARHDKLIASIDGHLRRLAATLSKKVGS